jgi:hypothetical protein
MAPVAQAVLLTLALWSTGAKAACKCCYSDAQDCDKPGKWCSKSESVCKDCGGKYFCEAAPAKEAAKKEDDSSEAAAAPQMLFAMPPSGAAATDSWQAEPLVLATVPGTCCYSGPKDCDSVRDWCSKDAARCDKCEGTFYNVTELALADTTLLAEEPPTSNAAGKCCYSGHNDCDGGRDWCSKGQSHCKLCGGTFHGEQEPSDDTAAAPATQLAAMPLQLAALDDDAAAAPQMERVDRDQRPQRQQREQPQQPENVDERSQGSQGNWMRFVPTQYRSMLKKQEEKDERKEARSTESRQAAATSSAAFLGALTESADEVPLPAIFFLSLAGLALVLAAAVKKASRRAVTLQSEALG